MRVIYTLNGMSKIFGVRFIHLVRVIYGKIRYYLPAEKPPVLTEIDAWIDRKNGQIEQEKERHFQGYPTMFVQTVG
jgi:hypothetical protein